MPAGVILSSGVISGTPTTVLTSGTFTITATASIGTCTGTAVYNYAVTCPTVTVTPMPTAQSYAVGTAISNITLGASGVSGATYTYAVTSGALPAGVILSSGVISGTPTTVLTSGTFTITATASIGTCTGTAVYNYAVTCPTVTITPMPTAQSYVVGTAISITLGATGVGGATYTYAVTSGALPVGVTLSAGVISGTPTTSLGSGTFTITATASIGGCTGNAVYNYSVVCPTIVFTNTTTTDATVGTAYSLNAGVTGNTGTIIYSVSSLPAGLGINATSGVISGVATAITASATYTVTATQGTCSATQTYTFGVVSGCSPVILGLASIPNAIIGTPYSQTFTATGGTTGATYTFSTASPQLATTGGTGLTLSAAGILSGTPNFSTSITFRVTATTTPNNCPGFKDYTFVINPNPTTAIYNSLANSVKVFPNPSSGDFNIDFGTINMAKSSVRVYDAQGKIIYISENNSSTNSSLMTISLDKFANGIYLLEVKTSTGRITKRLSKTN